MYWRLLIKLLFGKEDYFMKNLGIQHIYDSSMIQIHYKRVVLENFPLPKLVHHNLQISLMIVGSKILSCYW
jgi:hypothetical protein